MRIMNYSEESTFPKSMSDDEVGLIITFQKLLATYFKSTIGKENNPFVLGYTITLPNLAKREDAVFQPQCLDYSVSYGTEPKLSALNYLMMLGEMNKDVKNDSNRGILNSLIPEEMGSEMDAILGIDFNIFYDRYIKEICNVILTKLNDISKTLNVEENESSGYGFSKTGVSLKMSVSGQLQLRRADLLVDFGTEVITANSNEYSTSLSSGGRFLILGCTKVITLNPVVLIAIKKKKLVMTLQLKMNTKYNTNENKTFNAKNECQTSNYTGGGSPEGLIITLSPENGGEMNAEIICVENKEVLVKGEEKCIKLTNDTFSKKSFFNPITDKLFLEELKLKIESGIKSLPNVILPISNVYSYGALNFITDESVTNSITIESAYMPDIVPNKSNLK
jgi:hypothetical protein